MYGQIETGRITNWNLDSLTYNKRLHHAIQPNIFRVADSLNKRVIVRAATESFALIDTTFDYRVSGGLNIETHFGKFYSRTQALVGWNTRSDFTQTQAAFQPINNHNQQFFVDVRTRLVYDVNRYFTVQAGIDNLFYGEGHRSLFLGNQVAPAPFVNFRARFLNLEYGLVYQFLHDNNLATNRREWK
jgi:hypothetical protein